MSGARVLAPDDAEPKARKPRALEKGSVLSMVAPASPGDDARLHAGMVELERLGFSLKKMAKQRTEGYFAASTVERFTDLVRNFKSDSQDGVIGVRGGYGSSYVLGDALYESLTEPNVFVG